MHVRKYNFQQTSCTCELHIRIRIVAYLVRGSERAVRPGGGHGII